MAVYRVVGKGCRYARNYAHFPHSGEGVEFQFVSCNPGDELWSMDRASSRTLASAVRSAVSGSGAAHGRGDLLLSCCVSRMNINGTFAFLLFSDVAL